jgi:hypothetical protein
MHTDFLLFIFVALLLLIVRVAAGSASAPGAASLLGDLPGPGHLAAPAPAGKVTVVGVGGLALALLVRHHKLLLLRAKGTPPGY